MALLGGRVEIISSGPAAIILKSSEAAGLSQASPSGQGWKLAVHGLYSHQWQRNEDDGPYADLVDGFGVLGARELTLVDGSVRSGPLYGYRLVYRDTAGGTVTSDAVTAQRYLGGNFASYGPAARRRDLRLTD